MNILKAVSYLMQDKRVAREGWTHRYLEMDKDGIYIIDIDEYKNTLSKEEVSLFELSKELDPIFAKTMPASSKWKLFEYAPLPDLRTKWQKKFNRYKLVKETHNGSTHGTKYVLYKLTLLGWNALDYHYSMKNAVQELKYLTGENERVTKEEITNV